MTKLERLQAAAATVLDVEADEHAIATARMSLFFAAPRMLALWSACEAERDAVCDGSCEEDRHDDVCPVAIARAAVADVLSRGLP